MGTLTVKGVTIGDRFIHHNDKKSKRVSTVIDFSETKSMLTGKVLGVMCICEKDFMGQKLTYEVCSVTVLRNKI